MDFPHSEDGVASAPRDVGTGAQRGFQLVEQALYNMHQSPAQQQALFQLATAIMWFNKAQQDSNAIRDAQEKQEHYNASMRAQQQEAESKAAEQQRLIDTILAAVMEQLSHASQDNFGVEAVATEPVYRGEPMPYPTEQLTGPAEVSKAEWRARPIRT